MGSLGALPRSHLSRVSLQPEYRRPTLVFLNKGPSCRGGERKVSRKSRAWEQGRSEGAGLAPVGGERAEGAGLTTVGGALTWPCRILSVELNFQGPRMRMASS